MSKHEKVAEFNAKEMKDFKSVSKDQFIKINEDYKESIKSVYMCDTKILIGLLVLSGVAFFYFSGSPQVVALIIATYSLIEISKREAHREGYMDGYAVGRDEGINDVYGIDDDQAKFIEDVANDMELEESLRKENE